MNPLPHLMLALVLLPLISANMYDLIEGWKVPGAKCSNGCAKVCMFALPPIAMSMPWEGQWVEIGPMERDSTNASRHTHHTNTHAHFGHCWSFSD